MFIQIGDNEYELETNLGIGKAFTKKHKLSPMQIFRNLDSATEEEMQNMICIAAHKVGDTEFIANMDRHWGYIDLYLVAQQLLANLMFVGTPDQQEAKIDAFPGADEQKNAFRGLLGLPIKEIITSIGSE